MAPAEPPVNDSSQTPADHGEPTMVVGIGASAGGLEAFTRLLNNLPTDTGMAFVLVQHLDPNQPSLLTEIIARTTQMPVHEVEDGMAVAPNQVYVMPSNVVMTIAQGCLQLHPRQPSYPPSRVIDGFFQSLAEDQLDQAVGIVLSGADADGAVGLEAIKAAEGITFAQSEATAQVASMPHMAIATDQVDFIQTPEEIATTLASLSHHPYMTRTSPAAMVETVTSEAAAIEVILNLLRRHTQVNFSQYKPKMLKRRIFRRMALNHLESLDSYSQYLEENPAELQALYQEILINVTGFFRDPEVFNALTQEVFPMLLPRNLASSAPGLRSRELPIRIWVAGCSMGQEAYSVAICLLEYLAHQAINVPIQIFATDVSERAIEIARLGLYSPAQIADVSPERLQRFFVPVEGGYQINQMVRELCIFARQNLANDPPFSRLDLITCRNVLIYFGARLQRRVLPMFHYGLNPRGFLLLGSSETVGEFTDLFSLVNTKHKLYVKQAESLRFNFAFDHSDYAPVVTAPRPILPSESPGSFDPYGLADQIVLNRYGPVGVLVNAHLDILQFRGQTGAYLDPSPGRASLNLLTMAKEGLRLDLRTAIYQARQSHQTVGREPVFLRDGPQTRQIRIEVVPLNSIEADPNYYLVLFEDLPPGNAALPETTASLPATAPPDLEDSGNYPEIDQYRQEIQRLQQNLDTTRSHLQSIIQEQEATNQDLRAANEEILSSNEELQSTNEELQTAKEEIQATNEELSTINDELYHRNSETIRISNDFQNLLSSINIPILMVEGNMRIRQFTPTAAALFNLIPSDVGRPLSDINHRLTITDLEQRILTVIDTLNQSSQEVQDQEDTWYDLRIRPYRTLDDRIDGAVIVLVNIDRLKRNAAEIQLARDYADGIVQTVRESLVVLDANLRVITANQQFYETFQVPPADTEQQLIFDLGNGQWDLPQLRSLLYNLLPENLVVEDFEVSHNFENIGPKTMYLNARRMAQPHGKDLILLAIEAKA
ncbi:histidine kinase [filamentous cyanobacterium CCP5]|nr:histidine kinase [filamentous cyanobacterium CCP5]